MYLGEKTPLFVGTIKAFSTLATLAMMMTVTAFMAAVDDIKRNQADEGVNGQSASVANPATGREEKDRTWTDVVVGNFLVVQKDEEIPADVVLFYSSGEGGNCYVSTANLDGETNLKLKSAPPSTQAAVAGADKSREDVLKDLLRLEGKLTAEAPNKSIHDFNGRMLVGSSEEFLGPKQLLLRGTILKNTAWCVGLVVYTGKETRMVMNAQPAPLKYSNLEVITNSLMVFVLAFQCGLALICDIVYLYFKDWYSAHWYLYPPDLLLPTGLAYFLTFVVLYSNMMPISLYPTMEVCNYAQAYFIKNDKKMYYKDLKFPAGVKSMNLCQEIGQVSYIFSDKTGTLTQNVMELKRIFIPGHEVYGELIKGEKGFSGKGKIDMALKDEKKKDAVCNFLEILAVSHTVMVTVKTDGNGQSSYAYEAESPDEGALVESAGFLGHRFVGRMGQDVTLEVNGEKATYTVLILNEFNSTRKRFSVVVKKKDAPEGKEYLLLVKGADNVMLQRAAAKPEFIEDQLLDFSRQGLRTLVLGRKEVSKAEVDKWLEAHEKASRDIRNRDKLLDEVAETIEKDFEVAGATAIEDKLQDEVSETIQKVRDAGIKLWVLTGDKLETAKEIGFSSNVLSNSMNIHTLDVGQSQGGAGLNWSVQVGDDSNNDAELNSFVNKLKQQTSSADGSALMVTGAALEAVMTSDRLKDRMLEAAESLRVVIACRVSPLQKAEMVRLVREGKSTLRNKSLFERVKSTVLLDLPPVTLAVGDGANDVPMIQEAQVGVGIAGKEGRQAVNNSDFAIGQFRYLQRLLFVHGRWNYRRQCKFTKFTFWRNAVQVLMIVYYNSFAGFSGTSLFEDWIRLSFNFLCSLPIMTTGMFDRDLPQELVLKEPTTYKVGKDAQDLNIRKMSDTILCAVSHSLILFIMTYFAFPSMDIKGAGDYYTFGTAVYSVLICDMNYRVLFINCTHNRWTVGSVILSFLLYVVFLLAYPCNPIMTRILEPNMYQVPRHMAATATFWMCIVTIPACAMMMDISVSYWYVHKDPLVKGLYFYIKAFYQQPNDQYRRLGCDPEAADAQQVPSGTSNPSSTTEVRESTVEGEDTDYGSLDLTPFGQQEDAPASGFLESIQKCAEPRLPVFGSGRFLQDPHYFAKFWNLFIAVGLFCVGWRALQESGDAGQIRIHYDGVYSHWNNPWGTRPNEINDFSDQCNMSSQTSCRIKVEVPSNMTQPILMYYAIGPFYQNYNDYLKSEVFKELTGTYVDEKMRQTKCKQEVTRVNASGYHIFPCGMKATSVFNDTFKVIGRSFDTKNIAWQVDLDRYANPEDYGEDETSLGKTSWLYDRYPGVISEDEGVNNEHFATWMRPSAQSRVWNPYGYLYEDLEAGEILEIQIDNNYPMNSIKGGWKQLIITEVGWLGARHHGFAYLLLFGAAFGIFSFLVACYKKNPEDKV